MQNNNSNNIEFHDWISDEETYCESAAISKNGDIVLTLIVNRCDDGRGAFDLIDDSNNEIIVSGYEPNLLRAKSEAKALAKRRFMHIVNNENLETAA